MLALDGPAAVDGLEAWRAWKATLAALSDQDPLDPVILAGKARAERIIAILEAFPRGISARTPEFRRLVRQFSNP